MIAWLQRQRHVRFELMCDPVLAEPFAALDGERFRFTMAGSLADYLAWLEGLDIGLAPLLPAEFNRCRSDVKFLEHASRSVALVLQNLDPYRHLSGTGAALLFDNIDALIHQLDRLVNEPALRHTIATTAHALVGRPRVRWNRCSSRRRIVRSPPCRACTSWLRGTGAWASTARLISSGCGGWRPSSAAPWRRQCGALAEAVRLDPGDAHALSFLGHALQRQGRLADALAAFERAASHDPLQSRPVRALAHWHSRAARHYAERAAALNPLDDPPQSPTGADRP